MALRDLSEFVGREATQSCFGSTCLPTATTELLVFLTLAAAFCAIMRPLVKK